MTLRCPRACVQEDIKLNRLIYKIVPRQADESEFWRLYFSQVLYVLDCVKKHGRYPPPPPQPPAPPPKRVERPTPEEQIESDLDGLCVVL